MRRIRGRPGLIVIFVLALAVGVAAGSVALGARTRQRETRDRARVERRDHSVLDQAAGVPGRRFGVDPQRAHRRERADGPTRSASRCFCRYNGLPNPPPLSVAGIPAFGLVAQHLVLDQATVTALASQLDAIPPTTGAYSCPPDFGTAIIAFFRYASGAANPVRVGLSGCEAISNGYANRLGLDAPVVSAARVAGSAGAGSACPHRWLRLAVRRPGPRRLPSGDSHGLRSDPRRSASRPTASRSAKRAGWLVETARLRHGRFAATVPPGRYRVRLLGDGREVHGKVIGTKTVTARPAPPRPCVS